MAVPSSAVGRPVFLRSGEIPFATSGRETARTSLVDSVSWSMILKRSQKCLSGAGRVRVNSATRLQLSECS